jgi:hypothetical protein
MAGGVPGVIIVRILQFKTYFTVNGGTYEFDTSYPEAGDGDYCMELETIVQGVIPNQYGTWGFGRAGWCPGMD